MADVTVTALDATADLGITGVHFHLLELAAGERGAPEHDAEEEVYVVLTGDGTLHAGQDEVPLEGDHVVRVGADQAHHVVAGSGGLRLLAVATTGTRSYAIGQQPEVGGG